MFGKSDGVETFLGSGSRFKGDLFVKGRLRIDGVVEGNVEADWLVVGPSARIVGDVTGRGINVAGQIEGNVSGKELIEIQAKGVVMGDILCPKLSIHEGGSFSGQSTMTSAKPSDGGK